MQITNMEQCVGCAICEASCPNKAIQMKYMTEFGGFQYPYIDEDKCVLCRKCVSICTANKQVEMYTPFEYEIAQTNNIDDLNTATSGGVATSLVKNFIQKNNGIVYGAAFDNNMRVRHIRCATLEECDRLKGSKYVQSDMTSIHSSIQSDLNNNRNVLFIGTPCQCAAMVAFRDCSNFYMCDLVCNGVGSPEVFYKHLQYIEQKYKGNVTNYVFRPKTSHYLEPYEVAVLNNATSVKLISPWEKWGTLYYNSLVMRKSCYSCKYTSENRVGDICLSDIPEQLLNNCKLKADVKRYGATYISINTTKGITLATLIHEQCSTEKVDRVQKMRMKEPIPRSPQRDNFLMLCQERSLEKAKLRVFGAKTKIKGIFIKLKNNLS
jgi:4Fe-4S ferredoxin, iron-sulfur binding domain protein